MIVLLLFGLIHFYFIWFGDILFALRGDRDDRLAVPQPVAQGADPLGARSPLTHQLPACSRPCPLSAAMAGDPNLPPDARAGHVGSEQADRAGGRRQRAADRSEETGHLSRSLAAASWTCSWPSRQRSPFRASSLFGWETLALMLLGMAAVQERLPDRRLGRPRATADGPPGASASAFRAAALLAAAAAATAASTAAVIFSSSSPASMPFRTC